MAYSLASPKDGTPYREVSIIRDGLDILGNTCQDFPSFIEYV